MCGEVFYEKLGDSFFINGSIENEALIVGSSFIIFQVKK